MTEVKVKGDVFFHKGGIKNHYSQNITLDRGDHLYVVKYSCGEIDGFDNHIFCFQCTSSIPNEYDLFLTRLYKRDLKFVYNKETYILIPDIYMLSNGTLQKKVMQIDAILLEKIRDTMLEFGLPTSVIDGRKESNYSKKIIKIIKKKLKKRSK